MPITYDIQTADFDSVLGRSADSDNATPLTVVLRVALTPANPHGGAGSRAPSCARRATRRRVTIGSDWVEDINGRVFRIQPWGSTAFDQFKARFKRQAEHIWNDWIYILLPDPDGPHALSQQDYRALQNRTLIGHKTPYLRCQLACGPT
jgi:hypothetical protein